ncbi:MAG: hypothetical protein AAB353_01735 [Candidatus Hydrogenedentota bacterium]
MRTAIIGLFGVYALSISASATYMIPDDQLDAQKVFWGNPGKFEKAASVNVNKVIRATPEYEEIKKEKVERGTGKYWILLSEATDRAVKAISEVAGETEFDFIAAEGYLESLEPKIPNENITDLVLAKI